MTFLPKIATTLEGYTRIQFARDASAGVIVGVVALPLAIAFAIASGVTPESGLWTAIIAGFLVSALGGSRVQIGGPTGAFVVIVYGIVQTHGVDGLKIATMMAGAILVVMGVARLGDAITFIPQPLVTGFTSGIAVIIASSEIRDFFGLDMGSVPAPFLAKWSAYAHAAHTISWEATAVAMLAAAIILFWPRLDKRIPGPFVALVVTTIGVRLLELPVETIGSRFGGIPAAIPHPSLPDVSLEQVRSLVGPAFTIALLCAVESLLSAVVADGMIGGRHRSNVELAAQGAANLVAPLFGGIPATGAIARTATNVKNGGRTPVAGIVHALTLLVITLVARRWASLIPMATLAAILLFVAWHMCEWRSFLAELRSPRSDVAVLLTTFALTILVDLTVAIGVGMVLSAFLFMRRMASVGSISLVTDDATMDDAGERAGLLDPRDVPDGVEVYEINGPLFFGAARQFRETMSALSNRSTVLVLRMRHVPAIDSTGIRSLRDIVTRVRGDGGVVLLSELQPQPLAALRSAALLGEIGIDNVVPSLDLALARASSIRSQASPDSGARAHPGS